MIIGLTGTLGSGKDEAAKYFMKLGFVYHSCSDVIRDECKRKGLGLDRDTLIKTGNELREKNGPNILARVILERIKASEERYSLVVSIRNPSEVEKLKKQDNFVMIAVDAPIELRYERITERQRPEDKVSFEKFKEQEDREREGDENMQQLNKVIAMADFKIINDSTFEEFHKKLEDLVDYLKQKNKTKIGEIKDQNKCRCKHEDCHH